MHNKCVIIRPSGNLKRTRNMMKSQDVVVDSTSVSQTSRIWGMGYVCYTLGKFTYKGTQNDVHFYIILKKDNGRWTVVHGQRSTGRKPSEALPVFPQL